MDSDTYVKYNLYRAASKVKNIYIHLPFCRVRCFYCDFYSREIGREGGYLSDYIDALIQEFGIYREYLSDKIDTVYIGGGTPSVLPLGSLERLLAFLEKNIVCNKGYEFTFEMNPESVRDDLLRMIKGHGVNRISLGVQSMDDSMLMMLGRIHNRKDVLNSLSRIFSAGFENVCVDFLIGTTEKSEGIINNIEMLLSNFPIVHISAYILTLRETDTKYSFLLGEERDVVDQYKMVHWLLKEMGFVHYEVSNFSLSRFQCRHNINYWDCGLYVGLGASAAGHYIDQRGERVRYKNVSSVRQYIRLIGEGNIIYDEFEKIDRETHANEIIMLGLRKVEGIEIRQIEGLLGRGRSEIFRENIRRLREERLVRIVKDTVSPTLKGFIFNNQIARSLMF